MRAVRLHRVKEPVIIEEIEPPELDSSSVLVNMKVSGICASDLHAYDGILPPDKLPITLGHEGAGVVADVGERVERFRKGDRVSVHYVLTCGDCGFFAEAATRIYAIK